MNYDVVRLLVELLALGAVWARLEHRLTALEVRTVLLPCQRDQRDRCQDRE